MSTILYLLWGPTSTGKTSHSVILAKKYGFPVIALDRFQGYQEIKTGSGAPDQAELQGTERIYITPSHHLTESVVSSEEAHNILKKKISILLNRNSSVILEGGSVSLLTKIVMDDYWSQFSWRIRRFHMISKKDFIEKAQKRVTSMIYPQNGGSSILKETSLFFRKNLTIEPLEDIDGYRKIIQYCKEKNIDFDSLDKLNSNEKDNLIDIISNEYYEHALWQENNFPGFPASWSWRTLKD
ncbi:isopentenyl transferase family protein [Dickeya dianthicola]|uniref:isopentenyl transferase family protein n=1 Tax=Dickeya dianthicola TaxID=204039 RepID=UPI0004A3202A|nr:isopentenyl transferase family protein [Dickeya dianthicola]